MRKIDVADLKFSATRTPVEEKSSELPYALTFNADVSSKGFFTRLFNLKFREQVEWELDGLDRADVIAMWFMPGTKSPITLLELGLYARSGKLLVGCPEGFWRKGNIEVVCRKFDVPLLDDWDMFLDAVRARLVPNT